MRITTVFLLLLLILASCQRDEVVDMETRTLILDPPTNPVQGSLVGVIFDDSPTHDPISGATVTLGDEKRTTDESGAFTFDNIQLYEKSSYLTVEKEGYFDGSEKFNAIKDEVQNIGIQLISREVSGEVQTSIGGPIPVSQAIVDFPIGNYMIENGTYTGEMNIYAKWLDPTNDNVFSAFPGNLTGVTDDAQLKALASFGIIVIEVEGAQGQEIQLPEGATAQITMPIPEIMRDFAPEILELWSFDETNGTWVEEGQAFLEEGAYIAEVSHFSIWSLNVSYEPVTLSGLINTQGFPAINETMKIVDPEISGFITFTNTNSAGRFSVVVPKVNFLNLIIEGDCINTPYSQTIEPQLDSNPQEEPFELTSQSDEFTISGQVIDCDGGNVNQAWVRLRYANDNELLRTDEDGLFSINQSRCVAEPFILYAIDATNPLGAMVSLPEQLQGANNAEVHQLESCQEIDFGFDIDYLNMNWRTELDETVNHSWEWSFIDGLDITIINISITDDQDIVYMDGAIRYIGTLDNDPMQADYLLTFHTQGFSLKGNCNATSQEINGVRSFRFIGTQTNEPNVIDATIYPQAGVSDLTFDLVYFD